MEDDGEEQPGGRRHAHAQQRRKGQRGVLLVEEDRPDHIPSRAAETDPETNLIIGDQPCRASKPLMTKERNLMPAKKMPMHRMKNNLPLTKKAHLNRKMKASKIANRLEIIIC